MVDRVSAVFVPVVLARLLTLVAWGGRDGDWGAGRDQRGRCAGDRLSLRIGPGNTNRHHGWYRRGRAPRHLDQGRTSPELAHAVTTVAFDKTGTLTEGRPSLVAVHAAPGQSRDGVLRLSAALQQSSEHPLAAEP